MMKKIKILMLLLVVSVPASIFAHPGHGEFDGYNLLHFLTSEQHVAQLIVLVIAIVAVVYFRKRWKVNKR